MRKLLKFQADWCGPCHVIKPVVEKIASEHKIELIEIDIDSEQDIAAKYGVTSIPTLVLEQDGEEVGRLIGVQPKRKIESALGLTT